MEGQKIRYSLISQDMAKAVIEHLRDSFFADEPLNKAVGLCERGQPHAALERLCEETIKDGLSIAALCGDTVNIKRCINYNINFNST